MMLLAVVISYLVNHQMGVQLQKDLLSDGHHVAQQLAKDSRIALIQRAPENVQTALDFAHNFPNVKGVTIYTEYGEHFTGPVTYPLQPKALQTLTFVDTPLQILKEDQQELIITVPVMITGYFKEKAPLDGELDGDALNPTPDDPTSLGFVVLTMSKQAINRATTKLSRQLLMVIVVVAGLTYLVVMGLIRWLTAPIKQLAKVMTDPQTLERYTQIPVKGIREIRDIADAFNQLIISFAYVQKQLEQNNAQLEARIQERTKALVEANEAKSRFLSMISHEIRTPLHGITASTDLLIKTQHFEPQQFHFLKTVHHSANLLLDLINAVLDLSRLDVGTVRLQLEEFDLHALLQRLMMSLAFQANTKKLDFNLHISPDTPYLLRGDRIRLSQILTNLINNAIKFTEKGYVKVRVYICKETQNEAILNFEVTDTGTGIKPEIQSRIFDYFMQGDNPTVRRYGGAGLGTALAKGFVELMGGQIGLKTSVGNGSCFWFKIPFQKQGIGALKEPRQIKGLRVLIISANQQESHTWRRMLQRWGIPTRIEQAIHKAIETLHGATTARQSFTTVLIDETLIETSTKELAQQLFQHISSLPLSIILVRSTHSVEPTRSRKTVYSAMLHRPVVEEKLYRTLRATREVIHEVDKIHSVKQAQRPLRILVAEDNPTNQFVLRNILQAAGHKTHVVDDGEQALTALKEAVFDLAIIDMHMPRVSGHEVVIGYHQHSSDNALPIIMLTADATHAAAKAAQAAGVTQYLTKPISMDALLQAIEMCIAKNPVPNLRVEPSTQTETTQKFPSSTEKGLLIEPERLTQLSNQVKSPEIVHQFVNTYIQDAQHYLEIIEQAYKCKSWNDLNETLHALKGASAAVGSTQLVAQCHNLRQTIAEDDPGNDRNKELANHISHLRSTVVQVINALQPYRRAG
jgi:two-component system sensor histidine kinase RpfC